MTASVKAAHLYVQLQGKTRGPYGLDRVRSMVQRGRLGPTDQVSHDRLTWVHAGSVAALFPEGFGDSGPYSNQEAHWYYSQDGEQHGPVPLSTLQQFAATGQLTRRASVWKQGTPTWLPAEQVPELQFHSSVSRAWNSQSRWVKVAVVLVLLLTTIGPVGLLIASHIRDERSRAAEAKKLAAEAEERAEDALAERRHAEVVKAISAPEFHGRYKRGDRVSAWGSYKFIGVVYEQHWVGDVFSLTADRTYKVRVTWASQNSAYEPGQTYDFFEGDISGYAHEFPGR